MRISIRRDSIVPLYRQVEERVGDLIRGGALSAGHRLPSARELARDLGVNRLTIENAYGALEATGLLERRQGSGTYVLPAFRAPRSARSSQPPRWPAWQRALLPRNPPRQAPGAGRRAAILDFSTGMGDPSLIPARKFLRNLRDVLRQEGAKSLGYEAAQGYLPLRQSIAEVLASQGLQARPEQVLITSGAQQAISLVARALLRPGDTVIVEEATYDSAMTLFRMLGLRVVPAPMDGDGIVVERLETLVRKTRPRLLYCMPNFHNPTACVLHPARRQALVDLAQRHDFPILEDDYVGDLRYEGHSVPCLKALDSHGGVLHTSTFSKMLMPGLRLGFLLADGPVLEHLTRWKQHLEISSSAILQRALHSFISVGRYRSHVRRARRVYADRRDAMAAAVRREFPDGTEFSAPEGGLFLWLRLPGRADARALLRRAGEVGVAFAPGDRFFVESEKGSRWIRLNFAAREIPDIEEGMRRLGRLLRQG